MKESYINNIIKKNISTQLRPNETPTTINSVSGLLLKFLIIAILFFFLGYFICEYFEIYPFETNISSNYESYINYATSTLTPSVSRYIESFITSNISPNLPKIITSLPHAVNETLYPSLGNQLISLFDTNQDTNSTTKQNLDMNILRSQRYYQSVNNNPDAISRKQQGLDTSQSPPLRINSLIQELPATYMISNLNTIKSVNNTFSIPVNTVTFNTINDLFTTTLLLDTENNNSLMLLNAEQLKTPTIPQPRYNDIIKLFSLCKLYITTLINLELLNNNQSHTAHPFQFMNCIASQNLEFAISNTSTILTSNIILYRTHKTHSFNIQFKIQCQLINSNNNNVNSNTNVNNNVNTNTNNNEIVCKIIELELLGTTMQNDLPVKKLGMTPLLESEPVNFIGSPLSKQGAITGDIENTVNVDGNINTNDSTLTLGSDKSDLVKEWVKLNNSKNENIASIAGQYYISSYGMDASADINPDALDLVAQTKAKQGYDPKLYGEYKCFGVYPDGEVVTLNEIEDPITCQSYHPELEGVGVWDTKCSSNTDCPFYNTVTGENGCEPNTGTCDMPVNITRIGYTKYGKF